MSAAATTTSTTTTPTTTTTTMTAEERRAAMEQSFDTQSRARLGQLLSESRKMHRRSLSFSYCQAQGGGLETLLLACEVADQVMANLRTFAPSSYHQQQPPRPQVVEGPKEEGSGAESGAEWERVKEKNESEDEKEKSEEKSEAKAKGVADDGKRTKRHTRSLSESGVASALQQMANANQRACDRRRAQWEKKKKAQEELREKKESLGDEARIAEEQRKERERLERERKEQEALAAKNERLLRLFVKQEQQSTPEPTESATAAAMNRQKSESDRGLTTTKERKRSEEQSGGGGGDKTPRERRQAGHRQQHSECESAVEESEAEEDCTKALRSGSDIESAEEINLGVEEWERQQEEDEEGELWEDAAGDKDQQQQKKKVKLARLMKIKPKIMSGRRKMPSGW